ncbi:MAG: hypothetical protein AAF670_13760 [Planctomycetota bacterium]
MNTLEPLLEQHDNYKPGNGWSIRRDKGAWNVLYRDEHVDAWCGQSLADQLAGPLKSHETAADAIKSAKHDMTNGFFEVIASQTETADMPTDVITAS